MCILRIASREDVHMTCPDTLDPIIGRVHCRFSAKVEEVENRSKRSKRSKRYTNKIVDRYVFSAADFHCVHVNFRHYIV